MARQFMSLVGALLISLASVSPNVVMSQATTGPSGGPEWLSWRVFHDSLNFYERQAPGTVFALLKERIQVTELETSGFETAGEDFLQQLRAIDDEARAEIAERYGRGMPGRLPTSATPEQLLRPNLPIRRPTLVPGRTLDGRGIREAVVADGLAARVEARKVSTVRSHVKNLERFLGTDRVRKIEQWIASEVTPKVWTSNAAIPQLGPHLPPSNTNVLQPR